MKLKAFVSIITAFIFVSVLFVGCSNSNVQDEVKNVQKNQLDLVTAKSVDDMFTSRDLKYDYDEKSAVKIKLNGESIKSDSKNVTIKKSTVTIKKQGVYIVQGNLTNGQIVVDASSSDKVQLVLNGVNINCNTSAPIYVKQADKTFITLNKNTKNSLSVQNEFKAIDENKIDAAVFSKDDLTLNGEGELSISCTYGHGIVSKKDLKVTGGTFSINAKKHCFQAKNSIRIAGGTFNLVCEKDGFNCNYDGNKSDKGFVFISGGTLNINAGDDGIHASDSIQILNGKINISKSHEGIESASVTVFDGEISIISDDDGINASSGKSSNQSKNDMFAADESCIVNIYGGKITIDADGDGIDSNGNVNVTGGETYVEGPENDGNAALDYNGTALISSGVFVAVGQTGMAQNFSEGSTQCAMLVSLSGNSGDSIVIKDKRDNEILSYTPNKKYSCAVISHPDITQGNKYTVSCANESKKVKMENKTYSDVSSSVSKMNQPPKNADNRPDKNDDTMQPPPDNNVNPPKDLPEQQDKN